MNAVVARDPRTRAIGAFAMIALVLFAIDGMIARSTRFLDHADVLAPAIAVDLTLVVTGVYWLVVVRTKRANARSVLPVFLVAVAATALVLPPGHRDVARYARYLAIPFELAVVAAIVIGVRRTRRSLAAAGVELDVPERIRAVLTGSIMSPRIADIVATEAAMLYFAVAAWRRPPFVPSNARAFSYHRKNGYGALVYAVALMAVVEMAALDLVLRAKHHAAANVFLAFGAFAALWLLGLARSIQLRPVLVDARTVHVRTGLLWRLDVPRDAIEHVAFGRVAAPPKRTPGFLRGTPGTPNIMLELRRPLRAHGFYGMTRDVRRVSLSLDDVQGFQNALSSP
jgi:hypothetical protein